jgi:acetyl-CoA carboxylase biotin carboxyl carrier protein
MSLTHEDVQKILAILDEAECEEVRIEFGDLKLHLRRRGGSPDTWHEERSKNKGDAQARSELDTETAAPASPPTPKPAHEEAVPEGVIAVTAPMLGTFYRASSPGENPFVEQGDKVAPGDTVCLVEVMKLFNSVKAGITGTVEKILVENGTLVEYGQRLILIRKETP